MEKVTRFKRRRQGPAFHMQNVVVRFDKAHVQELRAAALRWGMSVSQLVRKLVCEGLGGRCATTSSILSDVDRGDLEFRRKAQAVVDKALADHYRAIGGKPKCNADVVKPQGPRTRLVRGKSLFTSDRIAAFHAKRLGGGVK